MRWSEPDAFDGVLCSSVVEYFDDPSPLLDESVRVLRPGGVMVVSVTMRRSITRRVQKAVRSAAMAVGADRFRYLEHSRFEIGRGELPAWLGARGLQIRSAVGFDPVVPSRIHRMADPALMICTAVKVA
jgi:SAM-dependent methyltransferase